MSAHNFPPYFDDDPRIIDKVTFAVVPFDSFSGRVVGDGVRASVNGLLDRPIRNLSGHLVFINLPQQAAYVVTVDASDAGYFPPGAVTFPPSDPADAKARRLKVPLNRLPSFPYAEPTTLIRGVVVRGSGTGAVAVGGASIWVKPSANLRFETTSDKRGAFALPLSRRHVTGDLNPYPVELHLKEGGDARVLNVKISDGKSHSFKERIDLTGTNTPGFFDPNQP